MLIEFSSAQCYFVDEQNYLMILHHGIILKVLYIIVYICFSPSTTRTSLLCGSKDDVVDLTCCAVCVGAGLSVSFSAVISQFSAAHFLR